MKTQLVVAFSLFAVTAAQASERQKWVQSITLAMLAEAKCHMPLEFKKMVMRATLNGVENITEQEMLVQGVAMNDVIQNPSFCENYKAAMDVIHGK